MRQLFTLTLEPEVALDNAALRQFLLTQVSLPDTTEDVHIQKLRQSIDARNRQVKVNLKVDYI